MRPVLHVHPHGCAQRARNALRLGAPERHDGCTRWRGRSRFIRSTRSPASRFTGNPTGVVLNADALTEAQMLAIARELNNAETAFILAPDADDHTLRARFFTPRSEAGFVGHATVAAHYVLSRRHEAPRWQRQKSKAGIVDIEVRGSDEDRRIAIRRSTAAARAASSTTASAWRCSMRWRWPPRAWIRAAAAHRRLEQHPAPDRRARAGAAQAPEARPGTAHDAVGTDRRGRLFRVHPDAARRATT